MYEIIYGLPVCLLTVTEEQGGDLGLFIRIKFRKFLRLFWLEEFYLFRYIDLRFCIFSITIYHYLVSLLVLELDRVASLVVDPPR